MIQASVLKRKTLYAAEEGLKLTVRLACAVLFFYFLIRYFTTGDTRALVKAAECIAIASLTFLPRVFKLTRTYAALSFQSFLLLAGVLGSICSVFEYVGWFDSLIHFFSGFVCTLFVYDYTKKKHIPLSGGMFVLCSILFCAGIAALWEIYEFCAFSVGKNIPLAARSILAEFGIGNTQEAAASFIKENIPFTLTTVQGFLKNEYDTFSDVLCALTGSGILAGILKKRSCDLSQSLFNE